MADFNITESLSPLYDLLEEVPTIIEAFFPIVIPLLVLGVFVALVGAVGALFKMIPKYLKIGGKN
jgi:hypothetical protein